MMIVLKLRKEWVVPNILINYAKKTVLMCIVIEVFIMMQFAGGRKSLSLQNRDEENFGYDELKLGPIVCLGVFFLKKI